MIIRLIAIVICLIIPVYGFAAEFRPGMDIFLYKVIVGKNKRELTLVANISDKDGYDNQPSFSPDNQSVLYSSMREEVQADIYQYHIASKKTSRLTFTAESEFSPMMERGGKSFTAVREGGTPYQSVHRYTYPNAGVKVSESSWAVKSHTPIGYYAFDAMGVAVAWARWAHSIYLFQPESEQARFVVGHAQPSRPFTVPNSTLFSFVHQQSNNESWIKTIDPKSRSITPLVRVLNNNIDYAWTPKKEIISGKGSELFIWKEGEENWQPWVSLGGDNIHEISRLAVSSDYRYIAVVAKSFLPIAKRKN